MSRGPTIPDTFPRRQAYAHVHNGVPTVIGFPGYEVRLVPFGDIIGREYQLISTPGQHDVNELFVPTPETIAQQVLDNHAIKPHWVRSGEQMLKLLAEAVRLGRGQS